MPSETSSDVVRDFALVRGVSLGLCCGLLIALSLAVAACGSSNSSSSPAPTATPTSTPIPQALTICPNNFALCAASTCTATGGTITLNDGKTYPAATCTCPVLPGPSIADVNAGNMQGSCTPPNGGVWSTYQINTNFPQAAATPAWSTVSTVMQICPARGQFAQCWNMACTLSSVVNGVQLANCTCPIETALTPYVCQAGLGNPAACNQLPVSAAVNVDPNNVP